MLNVAGGIADFSAATVQNTGGMSVNIGPTGLLLVPAGITPASFAAVTGSGLFHTAGTTLTIPAGQTVNGSGTINDPVICQGTITYPSGYGVNLANGLVLASGGTANLGNGTLNVNGPNSGMAGGTLSATYEYIGQSGVFTQSAGTNTPSGFYLGNLTSDAGTYNLSGGSVSAAYEYIGLSGTGTFNQSGGTNTITNSYNFIELGSSSGSGTYNLSGTGTLSAPIANIGYNGAGTVNQSGGTATFSGSLYLGNNSAGGHGAYSLSAGTLSTPAEYVGYSGTGAFTQTGGTNTVTSATGLVLANVFGSNGAYNLDGGTLALKALGAGSGNAAFEFGGGTLQATAGFSVSLPLVLTGTGGNAAVDTQGYALDPVGHPLRPRRHRQAGLGHAQPDRRQHLRRADDDRGRRAAARAQRTRGRPRAWRGRPPRRSVGIQLHRNLAGLLYPVDPGEELRRRLRRRLGPHLLLDRGRQRLGPGLGR